MPDRVVALEVRYTDGEQWPDSLCPGPANFWGSVILASDLAGNLAQMPKCLRSEALSAGFGSLVLKQSTFLLLLLLLPLCSHPPDEPPPLRLADSFAKSTL